MSQIDRFIEQLFEQGAEGLSVATDRPVVLSVAGEERSLTVKGPSPDQVESLLRQMAPPDGLEELESPGRHEFRYAAPSGVVDIRAYRTGSGVRFWVVPASERSGAVARGAAPGGTAGGAAASGAGGPGGPGGPAAGAAGASAGGRAEPSTDGAAGPSADDPTAGDGTAAGGPGANGPPAGVRAADVPQGAAAGTGPASEPAAGKSPPSEGGGAAGSAGGGSAADRGPETSPGGAGADVRVELPEDAPAIDRLLRKLVALGGSDLHVSAERVPLIRKDGEMVSLEGEEAISAGASEELLLAIAPERNREQFQRVSDTDFAHEIPGVARFRCNLFRDLNGAGGVFRVIPSEIQTAEDLGLPDDLLGLCRLSKGLVVVTGPTGSGKSTTLAAMIDYINRTRSDHIITIEDPVEFVHPNKSCLINQREVGVHTEGFKVALRAALREDPDIVLVGEMRDLETVHIALETAETGHLVFGTLHTNTAPSTVDRVIDQFPADQQGQIRTMLAESLKGVIAQTLCRKKGGGRVAAMEMLMVTNAVSNLIREGKTFQIPSVMQTGRQQGMVTMNEALLRLVRDGTVEPAEAYRRAVARAEFAQLCSRNGIDLQV